MFALLLSLLLVTRVVLAAAPLPSRFPAHADGWTSPTSAPASFAHESTITARHKRTCDEVDGIFEIEGRVTGIEGEMVYLTLTAEDEAGPVELLNGAVRVASLSATTVVRCGPAINEVRCLDDFSFRVTLSDPSAHPGSIHWRIDAEDHLDVDHDGTRELVVLHAYESPPSQELRVMVPPDVQYQEVIDGVPGATADTATWAEDSALPTYTLMATFPASPGPDPFWGTAVWTASATFDWGGEVTTTRTSSRSRTVDSDGLATATYLWEDVSLFALTPDDATPWTFTLHTTDEDGHTCVIPDIFELDVYADSGMVDVDRDGANVTVDGDCDDADPSLYPGSPDGDGCAP